MSGSAQIEGCLEFLEAAYAWDLPQGRWLEQLVHSFMRVWGRPRWACGFTYDVSDLCQFKFAEPVLVGGSPLLEEFLVDGMSKLTPDMLARSFQGGTMGFASSLGLVNEVSADRLMRLQTLDYFGINGRDASGRGCFVGLGADRTSLSAAEILAFQRLAFHLSSAYRLRRQLQDRQEHPLEHWEALVDPAGRVIERRGPADDAEEMSALSRATRTMERVRRAGAGHEATAGWRPRVAGRWTLVDAFSKGGRRYIVARENEAPTPGLEALTERERQVVASAVSGKSNKDIAYDLGISHATARVLLTRAYSRLGVRSRKELLELPIMKALRGDPVAGGRQDPGPRRGGP